jgi:hypothetical protein
MLSKSRFLAGLQCPLRLWHACFNRDFAAEISPAQQAIFDAGHAVGELATRRYPGGVLIQEDHLHHEKAVQTTIKAMQDPTVKSIYEAAFIYDGVRVRVDILEWAEDGGWNLVEVKSSTSVKEIHLPDIAIQYYVLDGSGPDLNKTFLLHINSRYVYDGDRLDPEGFFSSSDVTDEVLSRQGEIRARISELKQMLNAADSPRIQPSRHCSDPYTCEFWEHCTRHMPEHWVLELSGITQKKLDDLTAMNIVEIQDIPGTYPLTELQERIKACVANDEAFMSKKICGELKNVEYPAHFLDFETVSPAIPLYAGTRPYQTVPFQWSDHILAENGTLAHKQYLCTDDKDPREEFALTLLDTLGARGSIFIYTTYELRIIKALAEYLPQRRNALLNILDRCKDLCALIKKYFYHPRFHGSFSLKSVLPALVPDMEYKTLAIQEGTQAAFEYLRMIASSTETEEKEKIKKELLNYCGHDTLAMVKIRNTLIERSSNDPG